MGLFAGLPVAAVVQWNREPPRVVWSRIGTTLSGADSDDSSALLGSSHRLAVEPGGLRVTSLEPGIGIGSARGFSLSSLVRGPAALRAAAKRLARATPSALWVDSAESRAVAVDGVTWHRVRLAGSP